MNQNQSDTPIQPVEQPILCSPYEKPNTHWIYDTQTGEAVKQPGRRDAGYWYKTQRTGSQQLQLFGQEEWDDLPLVNALRADVERWRDANYRNATPVTRELLRHWARDDLLRRLFFLSTRSSRDDHLSRRNSTGQKANRIHSTIHRRKPH